jgi:dihydrolipoamide dehydrogenase
MRKVDLAVIGGGPSGYAAAVRALDFGRSVVLIERNKLGGAGIHNGALSSKTLWELGRDFRKIKRKDRGYEVLEYTTNFASVLECMHEAVDERMQQLQFQLDAFQYDMYPGQFELLHGHGRLLSENEVVVERDGQVVEHLHADYIILATGSRPRYLPHIPIDEHIIMTSDGLPNLTDFPKSLVILGAGVIGCEFATIFANFGKTEVFLIDKADRILPFEDEDVARVAADNLENAGVTIHRESSLKEMTIVDGQVKYVLTYPDGREETHFVERAIISVGRVPNIENMGLDNLDLKVNQRGSIECEDTCTSRSNIYAVGDLSADICLVNVGEVEGRHAVERIYGGVEGPLSYENVSTIMFLQPEVAGVGMNELQAQRQGLSYRVACYNYEYIARALAMRNVNGFFKILVTDDDEMRILGMRAVGEHASSTIQAVSLMIAEHLPISHLAELVHPHPSITEGVQECVRMLLGQSIMKPQVFRERLRCSRVCQGVAVDY